MELKVLGTVSPYCKEEHNCPGYLVTSANEKILLDCGNGISRELSLPGDLENLTIIISHLHKDHYGDLLSLGYATYVFHNLGYLPNRIKVYIPEPDMYSSSEGYIDIDGWGASRPIKKPLSDYTFLQEFGDEHYLTFETYNDKTNLQVGDINLSFKQTPHPIKTYSVKLEDDTSSFVYSADTGYQCNTLVDFAKDVDLLLCESSFLRGQTRIKDNHLYAYEAATIAKDANVRQLLLTHFFPECDPTLYIEEAKTVFEKTEPAHEGKVLKLGGKHE